jgi:hypothetical protein
MKNNPYIKTLFLIGFTLSVALLSSCGMGDNGITNKKELRAKKPPSVRIREDYDRVAKRASKGNKKLANKDGKALEKALDKQKYKKMKKDKRYIKKRRRKLKRSN